MNTIIYLYHSKEVDKFITERWLEKNYCLIRLGIPAPLWQNHKSMQEERMQAEEQPTFREQEKIPLKRRRRRRRRQSVSKEADKPQETLLVSDASITLWEELKDWQMAWLLWNENPYRTYCVYEDFLRKKLRADIWKQYWVIPEFEDYHGAMWVEKLIDYTIPGHYVILGWADCLPKILCENADKLRSIKWFVKTEQDTGELQDFIEDFYEEYGLVVEVHHVESDWIRIRPESSVPVNVLDFAKEEKISACGLAKGSIWLDMDSMDGKKSRMEARNPDISYFSLKKQWKQRQKEGFLLDTINKNRYNT